MDLNVRGVWLGLKHVMPVMQAQGGGSIILSASVSSSIGVQMMSTYAASKHALVGLGKSAAIEGGPAKVRVNMIAPGGIDGDMVDEICRGYSADAPDAVRAAFIAQVPLG